METNVTDVRQPPHDWVKEYAELSARDCGLVPGELERFAVAAHLLGEDEKTFRLLDRAHSAYLDQNAPAKSCPRGVLALSSVAGGAHYRLAELHRLRTALIDLEKNTEAFETPYSGAYGPCSRSGAACRG